MKRKVALLLAFIMMISLLPVGVLAQDVTIRTIDRENNDVPQTPTLVSKTENSLTVENRDGDGNLETDVEWMLYPKQGDTPLTDWMKGENGQITFSGLTDGTRYRIYARYAENDNQNASDVCENPLEVDTVYTPRTIKMFGYVNEPEEYLSGLFKVYLADENDAPTDVEVTTITAGESNAKRVVITLTESAREKYYINGYPSKNPLRYETGMQGNNSKPLNEYSFATTLSSGENGYYFPENEWEPRFSIWLFEKKENTFLVSENGASAVAGPVSKTVSYTGSAFTAQGALEISGDADYTVIPAITDTGMRVPAVCWKDTSGEVVANPVNLGTYYLYASLEAGTMWKETPETLVLTLNIEKGEQTAPASAPEIVETTTNSITVKLEDEKAVQFAIDDGSDSLIWHDAQSDNTYTFTGLETYTGYTIVARYVENDSQVASPASPALEAQTDPAPQNIGVQVKCGSTQLFPADYKVYEGDKLFDWKITGGEEVTITVKLSDEAKKIYRPNVCNVAADGITAVNGTCANGEYRANIKLNDYNEGGTVTFNLTEKETISVRVSKKQEHFYKMQISLTDQKVYTGEKFDFLDITYCHASPELAAQFTYFVKNDKDIWSVDTDWYDAEGNEISGDPVNVGTYKLITQYKGNDDYKPLAETLLVTLTITPAAMNDPVAPSVGEVTKNSVSHTGVKGQKYIVTTSADAPAANDAGWKVCADNGNVTQTGLEPNTQYYIHTFVPATDANHVDSAVVSVAVTTKHSYEVEVAEETTLTWNVLVGTDPNTLHNITGQMIPVKNIGTGGIVVKCTNNSGSPFAAATTMMTLNQNHPEGELLFNLNDGMISMDQPGSVSFTYIYTVTEDDENGKVIKEFKVTCVVNVVEKHTVSFSNFDDLTITYGDTYNMEIAQPQVKDGVAAYSGELEYYYTDRNGVTSTRAPLMAGTYTVTVKIPINDPNYTGQATANLTINKKEVELVGLVLKEKIYDGSPDAALDVSGAGLVGVLPGDETGLDCDVLSAIFNNANVDKANAVTIQAQLKGFNKDNYTLKKIEPIAATIKPREVSLVITAKDKVYDGTTDAEVTAAYAEYSGMLDVDLSRVVLKTENGTFADKNVGENKVVTCTVTLEDTGNQSIASNYTLKYDDATASINAKEVYVTFEGAMEHVYDGQPKQVTTKLEGVLENDTAAVNVVYGTDTTAPSLAGDYLLTATEPSDTNYKLASDPYTQEAASRTLKIAIGDYTPGSSSAEKSIGYSDTEEKSYDLREVFGIDIPGTFEVFLLEENEILAKHDLVSGKAVVQIKEDCLVGETATITYVFVPAANTYKSFTVTLHIKVADEIVERIEVIGAPDEVIIGTELDYSDITLQVTFKNGRTITFDKTQYMHAGYSTALTEDNLGTQTLTLTASGNGKQYAATKDINVKDKITGLELETAPTKTEYAIGETALDLTGGKVKASYKSGAKKSMELSDPSLTLSEVTEAMLCTLGEHEVTVFCTEETSIKTSFKFTVITGSDINPSIGQADDPEAAKEAAERENAAFKDKMLTFSVKIVNENNSVVFSDEPVSVQMAYPKDTDSESEFTLYMVKEDGRLEKVELTKEEKNIVFQLPKGFSEADLVLAWINTESNTESDTPGTGDAANPALWLGLTMLSIAGVAVSGIARRKLKREN